MVTSSDSIILLVIIITQDVPGSVHWVVNVYINYVKLVIIILIISKYNGGTQQVK